MQRIELDATEQELYRKLRARDLAAKQEKARYIGRDKVTLNGREHDVVKYTNGDGKEKFAMAEGVVTGLFAKYELGDVSTEMGDYTFSTDGGRVVVKHKWNRFPDDIPGKVWFEMSQKFHSK